MDKVVLNKGALKGIFEFLTQLDAESKKKIIKRLQETMKKKSSKGDKTTLADFAGIWHDERSAEEIIADIKTSGHLTRDIEPFE